MATYSRDQVVRILTEAQALTAYDRTLALANEEHSLERVIEERTDHTDGDELSREELMSLAPRVGVEPEYLERVLAKYLPPGEKLKELEERDIVLGGTTRYDIISLTTPQYRDALLRELGRFYPDRRFEFQYNEWNDRWLYDELYIYSVKEREKKGFFGRVKHVEERKHIAQLSFNIVPHSNGAHALVFSVEIKEHEYVAFFSKLKKEPEITKLPLKVVCNNIAANYSLSE